MTDITKMLDRIEEKLLDSSRPTAEVTQGLAGGTDD